jgi:hypothetical protein
MRCEEWGELAGGVVSTGKLVVGARLIEPYFSRIINHAGSVRFIFRKCRACGHTYTTAETPMYFHWPEDVPPDRCPEHSRSQGRVVSQASVDNIMSGAHDSSTFMKVVQYGGYYRRYQCSHVACDDPKTQKPKRWTTIELSAEGVVVQDIIKCDRCGERTKAMKRKTAPDRPRAPRRRGPTNKCYLCGKPSYACICDLRGM